MRPFLFAWLMIVCALEDTRADDAIDWQGKAHRGDLIHEAGEWAFRGTDGKVLPITQIAYIRFGASTTPLPKTPWTHTLHLPNRQHCAGMLRSVDAKQIGFVTSWGKTFVLQRDRVAGVEQPGVLLHDDFEQSLQAWQLDGKPILDRNRAFSGSASLVFDQPKQRATREWKTTVTEGDIRLYFFDPANNANPRFSFDIISNPAQLPISTLVIDSNSYGCDKQRETFGVLRPSAGWHQLSLELRAGRLRVVVDDSCLGEQKGNAIRGIRISANGGKLWIDDLTVSRRLPALALPQPTKDYDTLWLNQGEQLFGHLVSADRGSATLESKLGKRALPWSQVRGILFAQPKPPNSSNDPEISFRPGPGFPLDQLRAKLVRWEGGTLIVHHEMLGEIAIERDRLEKVRWLTK